MNSNSFIKDKSHFNNDDSRDNSEKAAQNTAVRPWKVMVIDDDDVIHSLTRLILEDFVYEGRKLEIIDGYSAEDARKLLQEHPDTAVLLLDIIMETDVAGLDVVNFVRENLQNKLLQIILRTGQAGPYIEEDIVKKYNINDFRDKSDLTSQKLNTAVITSLRAYQEMQSIQNLVKQCNENNIEKMILKESNNIREALNNTTQNLAEYNLDFKSRLMNIINDSQSFIFIKDVAGRYLLVNERFEEYFDMSNIQALGKTDKELFSDDIATILSLHDFTVIQNANPIQHQCFLPGKSATSHYITIKFPLYDYKGEPHAICGIATNIEN